MGAIWGLLPMDPGVSVIGRVFYNIRVLSLPAFSRFGEAGYLLWKPLLFMVLNLISISRSINPWLLFSATFFIFKCAASTAEETVSKGFPFFRKSLFFPLLRLHSADIPIKSGSFVGELFFITLYCDKFLC